MGNTISASLKDDIIRNKALQGFVDAVLPLALFSFDASPDAGVRGQSVTVGLVSTQEAASFNGDYTADPDSQIDPITVTLNIHKFKTVHLTDIEVANSSILKLEDFGYQAGQAVGLAFVAECLALITAANYGAAVFTGGAAAFDSDDVVDIRTALNVAKVPVGGRNLILSSSYTGALQKDDAIKSNPNFGDEAIRNGTLGRLSGFRVSECDVIPDNDEHLVGFCGVPAGMAVGMRYLAPQAGHKYSVAEPLVDDQTGLVLGVREFYDEKAGKKYLTFEALGGAAKGIAAGLKRIVSE